MKARSNIYQAKVYPYGGFSVTKKKECSTLVPSVYGDYRKVESTSLVPRGEGLQGVKLGFKTEYKYPSVLGLSSAAKNHSPRARRGLKGFTSANKHMIKSASWLMQQRHGRKNLSFLTVTLPPRFANGSSALNSELIRRFIQKLKRLCQQRGIWHGICGVCEIQAERFETHQDCALHWHLVYVGKPPWGTWIVSCNELRDLWRSSLSAVFGVTVPAVEVLAAIDVQRIKKDVSNYLGKYLSKGSALIEVVVAECGEDVIPSSWMVCSHSLKRLVDQSIIRLQSGAALQLMDVIASPNSGLCKYSKHLFHEFADGGKCWIALYGTLTGTGVLFAALLRSSNG